MAIIRAAGGIVWRPGRRGAELVLVHRPHRDDWSLPKGKLEPGERWEEAALREVREEAGCLAHLASFAASSFYGSRRGPKLVLYWHMVFAADAKPPDGSEVDDVAWLTPAEAYARVHRERDRRVIAQAATDARAMGRELLRVGRRPAPFRRPGRVTAV